MGVGVFTSVMIFCTYGGGIARGEIQPNAMDQFTINCHRHGLLDALFGLLMQIIFYLWAFVIPSHVCASHAETARRPWYLYVINVLVGLLLCTPHNPTCWFM